MRVLLLRILWGFLLIVLTVVVLIFGGHELRSNAAESHWEMRIKTEIAEFGQVERLTVTVLSGPYAKPNTDVITEPGFSIHLEIDGENWLFDLGLSSLDGDNAMRTNAHAVGKHLSKVNAVFLSHRHRDHMGGVDAERTGQINLNGIGGPNSQAKNLPIFTPPNALDMIGQAKTEIHQPTILGDGIASLGPIRRALFIGTIDEQALVIDVRGYGLVAIVGCGHQTLDRLRIRIEEVFGRKLAAVVGDLHYPVPKGRLRIAGIDAQRRLASGRGPFQPISQEDVTDLLTWARTEGVALYLVGHDTHDSILGLQGIETLNIGETVIIEAL